MRFTVVDTDRSGGGNGNWRCNRFQPKPIDRSSHLNTIKTLVKFQERRAHPLSVREVRGLSVLFSDQPVTTKSTAHGDFELLLDGRDVTRTRTQSREADAEELKYRSANPNRNLLFIYNHDDVGSLDLPENSIASYTIRQSLLVSYSVLAIVDTIRRATSTSPRVRFNLLNYVTVDTNDPVRPTHSLGLPT